MFSVYSFSTPFSTLMNVWHLSPRWLFGAVDSSGGKGVDRGGQEGTGEAPVSASFLRRVSAGISVGQLGLGHMQQIKSRFDKLLSGWRLKLKDKRMSGRRVVCVSFLFLQRFMRSGSSSWQAIKKQLMKSANSALD